MRAVRRLLFASSPVLTPAQEQNGSTRSLLATQNTGRGGSGSRDARAQQERIIELLQEHLNNGSDRVPSGSRFDRHDALLAAGAPPLEAERTAGTERFDDLSSDCFRSSWAADTQAPGQGTKPLAR